jgi:type IV secretion system protein VirB11
MKESKKRLFETLYFMFGEDIRGFLEDSNITEIYTNSNNPQIRIDTRNKGMIPTGKYLDPDMIANIIYTIADLTGTVCNERNPSLAADFNGIRFQGLLPPVVKLPKFNMRKHSAGTLTLDDYVATGVMTETQKDVLAEAVWEHKNIIAAGGTRSGKTTFLNAILTEVAKTNERVVILEDTAELQCAADDVDYLKTSDEYDMAALLRDTLRLTPNRIVVGETRRGAEALTLLDAWSTGHSGGCSTVHSNSAMHTLRRLEELTQRAEDRPHQAMIAEAVNIIAYLKMSGLKRKLEQIIAVDGWDYERQQYVIRELA